MANITIEPATGDRFDDAQHAFGGGGDGPGCQCQWWMIPNVEWQKTTLEQRQEMLRDEMDAAPPPALIAYVDGEAAGWVRVGPRSKQIRLARTRAFAEHSQEPWDDPSVWTVSCFVVRKEFRGQGLTDRLLAAAVDYAQESGARVIEAYPFDPHAGKKIPVNDLYHGVASTFEAAGFREIARPKPHFAIVSLDLTER